ncbi:hypothetical protein [Cellulosimicrobium protaetiae]|uniref:FAD-binding domain-containing protein n=1 Tax=Cellulosimicrobium protaetiae TaxID=2587808 RepID=A0A6M5UE15_9MICO|nr:hypothetical protein [Cellulosimicrobium protaetiae]QJW35495.1 hypothetical protein FIC82_004040 [Cellulosimicrobium protaetiae]
MSAALGLGDRLRDLAALQGEVGLRRPDGRWLVRANASAASARFGDQTLVLLRAQLVGMVADALPDGALRLGVDAAVVDLGDAGRPARVRVRDAVEQGRDVGRDGAVGRSGDAPRQRDERSDQEPSPGSAERRLPVTGRCRGDRGGARRRGRRHRLADPATLVARCARAGPRRVDGVAARRRGTARRAGWCGRERERGVAASFAELRDRLADGHAPIPDLLASVDPDHVLCHKLRQLPAPPTSLVTGRVALVGDAANAMLPNVGQGWCQALDGAGSAAAGVPEALRLWSAERRPRVTKVMERSAQMGGCRGRRHPSRERCMLMPAPGSPGRSAWRWVVNAGWRARLAIS